MFSFGDYDRRVPAGHAAGQRPDRPFFHPFYPTTSHILQLVVAGFGLCQIIIIVFYSGELVWRERDAKVSQIMDAMPPVDGLLWLKAGRR